MKIVEQVGYDKNLRHNALLAEIRDDEHTVEISVKTLGGITIPEWRPGWIADTRPCRTVVILSYRTPEPPGIRKTIREYDTWEEAMEGHVSVLAAFRLLGSVDACEKAIISW